jgi:protein gp37
MELPEFMAPNHGWALPNVWLGTSAEDQQRADERIPFLLECPAVVRFVSYEPALEAVRFARWMRQCTFGWAASGGGCGDCDPCVWTAAQDGRFLNWLVIGGESGPNRRPFDLAWLESVAEQCDTAGVPLFVKQDGAFRPGEQGRIPDRLWARKEFPR